MAGVVVVRPSIKYNNGKGMKTVWFGGGGALDRVELVMALLHDSIHCEIHTI